MRYALFLLPFALSFGQDLKVKVRLQPRFDFGSLTVNSSGQDFDAYLRRVRLSFKKKVGNLLLDLTLKADKAYRDFDAYKGVKSHHGVKVGIHYAFADWKVSKGFSLLIGIKKKAYTRQGLVSSSRQLLIERAHLVETAKKWLGDYYDFQVMFHGKIKDGVFRYMVSLSDGQSVENKNKLNGIKKERGGMVALRLEFSPPNWIEKKKDDTTIGKGRAISFGISYASNNNLKYKNQNTYATFVGGDLFFRYKNLVFSGEYLKMEYKNFKKEEGFYVQGGYLIRSLKLEPALRYEVINNRTKILTFGINRYYLGHHLKWSFNVVNYDQKRTFFQVQGQYMF